MKNNANHRPWRLVLQITRGAYWKQLHQIDTEIENNI
jgi:hypothetical protein